MWWKKFWLQIDEQDKEGILSRRKWLAEGLLVGENEKNEKFIYIKNVRCGLNDIAGNKKLKTLEFTFEK